MSKAKGWLIAATALTVSGLVLIGGTLAAVGFNIKNLSTAKYTDVTKVIDKTFDSIDIDVATLSVELAPSEEKECRLEFHERENKQLSSFTEVENNTLVIRDDSRRNWFVHITFFDFDSPKLTVYLPKNQFDSIKISEYTGEIKLNGLNVNTLSLKTTTGSISAEKINVSENAEVKTATGSVKMTGVTAKNLTLNTTTGSVLTESVTVKNNLEASATTGCIKLKDTVSGVNAVLSCTMGTITFDSADAANIYAHTTTGAITGTLRSEKQFTAQSRTGGVNVPKSGSGGKCDLSTTTGDIKIEIE